LDHLLFRAARGTAQGEVNLQAADGRELPVSISFSPLKMERAAAVCAIVTDLRPVRRAQQALRDSTGFNTQIINSAREGIVVYDKQFRVRVWNRYMEEMTGIAASEAIGQTVRQIEPTRPNADKWEQARARALAGDTVRVVGEFVIAATGRSGWISTVFSPLRDGQGQIIGLLAIKRDVTKQRRVQQELRERTEQLSKLNARLQQIREEEGTRIAREIHDQVGQALTALNLEITSIRNQMPPEFEPFKNRLRTAMQSVDEAIRNVQKISRELRPPALDVLGLAATVEGEVLAFKSRTGIDCRFQSTPAHLNVPKPASVAIFRIVQECLTNVARHAEASCVNISLARENGIVRLSVRDNGKGFSIRESLNESLGVIGMRERALNLGGQFSIESAPDGGTTVAVEVPLPPH
jgi:PAS domain S-box-containing protein